MEVGDAKPLVEEESVDEHVAERRQRSLGRRERSRNRRRKETIADDHGERRPRDDETLVGRIRRSERKTPAA